MDTVLQSEGSIGRWRLHVGGRVQGVGFRPFVFRLAGELRLCGFVGNDSRGVFIEIEGTTSRRDAFITRLQHDLPPLARVTDIQIEPLPVKGETTFGIQTSRSGEKQEAEISPDVATCDACLAELFDPADRRYRYPFINCTNCGPRYSIIRGVPYDRPNTTMAVFKMCAVCQAEYDHPADRRFHAQPNACPLCGPRVWLTDGQGRELSGDPIRMAAASLRDGKIIAIKGIGGFHLACRADDDGAVKRLRLRKGREAKPLAVMVASLESARRLADIDEPIAALLTSPARPIVLAPKKKDAPVSRYVAPGVDCYGIILPYAPLHHLLFAEGAGPLVMTSGNPTEEPLCCDNDEAIQRLAVIADEFLLHDRAIERRVDDSVVAAGPMGLMPIRRARGYAPEPIRLDIAVPQPVLAVGAELKSTICLLKGSQAVLSEHLGELANARTYRHFVQTIEQFKKLLRAEPAVVACDRHPEYAATRYARGLGLPMVEVQHHHAHIVSCMAENCMDGTVVGICCDGTGYGLDGAIWGGEILTADRVEFRRAAHLDYFPLFGGDAAARETWRPAAGLLYQAYGADWRDRAALMLQEIDEQALSVFEQRMRAGARLPRTSSLGRLFDAVAFLLGLCRYNRFEAEAAMMLEAVAREYPIVTPFPYNRIDPGSDEGPVRLDVCPMIEAIVEAAGQGRPAGEVARGFHETVAVMLADAAIREARQAGPGRVVLSGGCFANRLLLERMGVLLNEAGLEVYAHQQVPTGDGGVALGQAVVAAERLRRNG